MRYLLVGNILHILDDHGIPIEECSLTSNPSLGQLIDEDAGFYGLVSNECKLCYECAQSTQGQDLMAQVREDLDAGPSQGV